MQTENIFCPKCAQPALSLHDGKQFKCASCGFAYFHNVASAVGVFIQCGNEVLLARRARDPGKDKLGIPGGFVDPGETAEQALRRECLEELGVNLEADIHFIGGWPNQYPYQGVLYNTLDIYFHMELTQKPVFSMAQDEVSELIWQPIEGLRPQDFAFCSAQYAMTTWLQTRQP